MYDPDDALALPSKNQLPNPDTSADNARDMVQGICRDAARSQGGTEHESFDPSDKGNDNGFDLDKDERVNSDPQLFQWNEQPRRDDNYTERDTFGF